MSLSVGLFRETPDGRYEDVRFDPPPPCTDQAGSARWPQLVYGDARAKNLGLRLLPTLADAAPIFVKGPELALLKYEVEVLKADYLREYEKRKARQGLVMEGDLGTEKELYVVSRLENILAAVQFALDNHGLYGVIIG